MIETGLNNKRQTERHNRLLLSVRRELKRFGIFLIILEAIKLVLIQGVYLGFGFGLQTEQLKTDTLQLAVICAVYAMIYIPLCVYIRAQRR